VKPFTTIDPNDFNHSVFKMIGGDWMVIAAEKAGKVNAMTASWGGMGVMWGRKVTYTVIRPQRYTKEFVDASETFSLNFLNPAKYREIQSMLGSVSGRDVDKIAKSGFTVDHAEKAPYFAESDYVFICRKLFHQPYDPASFIDKKVDAEWYPDKDYHTLYISEILSIFGRE
jgi:Conserved protein/domain typically associated with flavoprotein oxygenases, DIM6/NTAB family